MTTTTSFSSVWGTPVVFPPSFHTFFAMQPDVQKEMVSMAVDRYTHVWLNRLFQNNTTSFDLRVTDTLAEFSDYVVNKNFGGCISVDDPLLDAAASEEIRQLDEERTLQQFIQNNGFVNGFLDVVPEDKRELEVRKIYETQLGISPATYADQVLVSQLTDIQTNHPELIIPVIQSLIEKYPE